MTDSSSSSDEEEKAKLQSAAWPGFSTFNVPKLKDTQKAQPKPSLRHSDELAESTDYRSVDATPELKAFIAKKLTSWLDSSISVVDGGGSGARTSKSIQDGAKDDFMLFSTSTPGAPVKESPPQKRKQRPQPSSSDSDSDEERSRLASVAVSYQQILQSARPPTSQDQQVTSNLSPTNNPSPLNPADPPARQSSAREEEFHSKLREGRCPMGSDDADTADGSSCHGNRRKKKKQKRKAKGLMPDCVDNETAGIKSSKSATESKIENPTQVKLPTNSENGHKTSPEHKKRVKKKKKQKLKPEKDSECQRQANNRELSVR